VKSAIGFAALAAWVSLAGVAEAAARAPASAPSTESLITSHVAARGGMAALQAIHTVKMIGVMRPGGFDAQFGFSETMARPDEVRLEATLQGLTVVQAYDGRKGWQIQPFQGRKDAEDLSADDAKSLQEEGDFEDGLIDARAKGSTIDNLGSVDVDGAPTWALRVSLKNGDQETYYLDPDAMLAVRMVTRQVIRGAETFTQTDYGDYEKVAGVYFPFEVASGPKGSTIQQRVTYKTIEANVPVDPAIFARPSGPAATPGAGAPSPVAKAPGAPVPVKPKTEPVPPPPAAR